MSILHLLYILHILYILYFLYFLDVTGGYETMKARPDLTPQQLVAAAAKFRILNFGRFEATLASPSVGQGGSLATHPGRNTHTHTHRQTDRQKDRQTDKQTDKQTDGASQPDTPSQYIKYTKYTKYELWKIDI